MDGIGDKASVAGLRRSRHLADNYEWVSFFRISEVCFEHVLTDGENSGSELAAGECLFCLAGSSVRDPRGGTAWWALKGSFLSSYVMLLRFANTYLQFVVVRHGTHRTGSG